MDKASCLFLLCTVACLRGQVADVHSVESGPGSNMRGGFMRGGRYELRSATMVDLIRTAYGVDAEKVIGGPGWLDTDRFDAIAKGPAEATPESLRLTLQALLADRFKLVVHSDARPFPEYVLKTGKHPLLKEAAGGGESGCKQSSQTAPPGASPNTIFSCRNLTMAEFANRLPRMAANYFQMTPVADLTGLKGSWDFTVHWTGRGMLAAAGTSGITVYDAIDKQLGLKLEVQNVAMPVVVVDSVNEKPTANPPGVSQSLPVTPTEFEVAVIKPSAPGAKQSFRVEPGDRIDLRGFALRRLIKFAWDFQDNDVRDNDDMLVGGPKWLETERFDIVARPAAPATSSGPRTPVDIVAVGAMLRALLADRFRLATHSEEQPITVYALVAVKARLKRADSANRTGCRNVPDPPGNGNAPGPVFSLDCRNITMAQLAEKLQPMGGIYIPHPVIDSTGLTGAWDFGISWSPPHLLQGCGGCDREAGLAAAAAYSATDPNGSLSLVEALDKQLGLKLKLEKHLMPVLVIDHVESTPTDN